MRTERETRVAGSIAMTLSEAAAAVGLSRTTIYEAWWRGELPTVTVGRRRLVLRKDLETWLSKSRRFSEDRGPLFEPAE